MLTDTKLHISPFTGVRWRQSVAEVELKGTWYELLSLNGVPAEEIVSFCKTAYGRVWRKRFEEDLVMVLKTMGKGAPFDVATLEVRPLAGGKAVVFKDLSWTEENRNQIFWAAMSKAKDNSGKDPRDDPTYP